MPAGVVNVLTTTQPGPVTAAMLAERSGLVVSPGEFYGPAGKPFVRLAVVQPTERLEVAAQRLLA